MRIDEVEMISMLMPASASASNMSAATPGIGLHAGADERDLGDSRVGRDAAARRLDATARRAPASRLLEVVAAAA